MLINSARAVLIPLLLGLAALTEAALPTDVTVGTSEHDATLILGEPRGRMKHRTGALLIYPDFMIDIVAGKVAKIKGTPKIRFVTPPPQPDTPPADLPGANDIASPGFPPMGADSNTPADDFDMFLLPPDMQPPGTPPTPTAAPPKAGSVTEKKGEEEPPKPLTPREKLQLEIKTTEEKLTKERADYGATTGKNPRRRARKRIWRLREKTIPALKAKLATMDKQGQ